MTNTTLFYLWMIVVVLTEVLGDYLFKRWSQEGGWVLLLLGGLGYFLASLAWASTLRYEGLVKSLIVFVLASLFAGVAVGVIIFGEEMTPKTWVALALTVGALCLVE